MKVIKHYLPIFLSFTALAVSLFSFYNSRAIPTEMEKKFAKKILTTVRSCVEYNQEISGKDDIYHILSQVEEQYKVIETGSDDLRVKYVHSQGCFEHVLACFQALGDIEEIIGVIHTPMPATPLCIKPEGEVRGVLDQSIRHDLSKLLTVRSRAQIIREYLMKGAKLYIVYPQGGFEKRSATQQSIYKEELERFAGNLFDWVLTTNKIADDMVGATYLFRNMDRQVFAFSIKSKQANDIHSQAEWGIWFGPVVEAEVADRVNNVFDYLSSKGGPDLRDEI